MDKKVLPILVVDDEKPILIRHKTILSKYFGKVITATNGEEAWQHFKANKVIPVVITDIQMPNKDGIWLINQIRSENKATQIIIISTLTKSSVAIFSTYRNISYLPKPVDEIYLRLAAMNAYNIYAESVWINMLRDEICKFEPDEDRIWQIVSSDPWRKDTPLLPEEMGGDHQNDMPLQSLPESAKTETSSIMPGQAGSTADNNSLEMQKSIAKAKEVFGEEAFEAFWEELKDISESVEIKLLDLEQHPQDQNLIGAVFRDFHTIKGNCGMMGFTIVEGLTHRLEDVFSKIRSGDLLATPNVIDTALTGKDIITRLLQAETGETIMNDQKNLHEAINSFM
ncbi:MAG: response regulator [Desulfobulbaceae bacterium]|nr:response regulator [Desulfobulbaceae bacterium]HIJ78748.1 response regulator [Deltaproteobacteria bacterium]